jgi:hypothetical protein
LVNFTAITLRKPPRSFLPNSELRPLTTTGVSVSVA